MFISTAMAAFLYVLAASRQPWKFTRLTPSVTWYPSDLKIQWLSVPSMPSHLAAIVFAFVGSFSASWYVGEPAVAVWMTPAVALACATVVAVACAIAVAVACAWAVAVIAAMTLAVAVAFGVFVGVSVGVAVGAVVVPLVEGVDTGPFLIGCVIK